VQVVNSTHRKYNGRLSCMLKALRTSAFALCFSVTLGHQNPHECGKSQINDVQDLLR